jgi:hypothetical protein
VTRIGATGHQNIPAGAVGGISASVRDFVRSCRPPLVVFSSLAAGGDQLISQVVLEEGGRLAAVIPSVDYETTLADDDRSVYDVLLESAQEVIRLSFSHPSEEAYLAAGKAVVDRCSVLIAIWDGEPARGLGGTADIVRYASQSGKDVHVIWPEGLIRG